MRPLPTFVALVGTGMAAFAQANCSSGPGAPTSLPTRTPFTGGSVYGHPNFPAPPPAGYTGFSFLFDLTVTTPIEITQLDLLLYDDGGLVNTGSSTVTMPNQLGATAPVEFYVLPFASWIGQETSPGAWAQLATGTLTVASRSAHSIAILNTPVNLSPGLWGVAYKVDQATTGPAPGPLHPLVDVSPTTPGVFTNADMTITNLQFQRESWQPTLTSLLHGQNLEIHYRQQAGVAEWTSFGAGCVAPNEPVLGLNARPITGTTITFETTNIAPGTVLNFWLFGLTPDPTGLDLTAFGMPGCRLYLPLAGLVNNLTGVSNGMSTVALPIPNLPIYSGVNMYAQAAPMTPGVLPAGFVASNAICLAVGSL